MTAGLRSGWRAFLASRAGVLAVGTALVVGLVVGLPQILTGYQLRFVTTMLMVAGLAQGLNVVAGFVSYPALGNVAFWGLGAYIGGITMNAGVGFGTALVVVCLGCGLLAVILAVPFMRLRGSYFLMATIGLNEVLRQIVTNFFTDQTGGGLGLRYPLLAGSADEVFRFFFLVMASLAFLSTVCVALLKRSRLGIGMLAIGADEDAAAVLGVPTMLYKAVAWGISAAIFGVFGLAYGYWTSYIDPLVAFDIIFSVEVFIVFLVGGAGAILGPLVGAAVVQTASELVWLNFLDFHVGALGVLMIAVVLLLPKGGLGQALGAPMAQWRTRRAIGDGGASNG